MLKLLAKKGQVERSLDSSNLPRGKKQTSGQISSACLILATSMMTRELKAHEYGKDANSAGVYSGLVLHSNLHP